MVRRATTIRALLICCLSVALFGQLTSNNFTGARTAEQKFAHIEQNGRRPHPDPTPTVLTEDEVNSWFSSGEAGLPKGISHLQLRTEPGVVHGSADVDFDQVTAGRYSANPLMSLFSGVHHVIADAHAEAHSGTGEVHIDSVSIDGVTVPRMALEYFVSRYIHPKYPNLGIDSTFKLPDKIDSATVGSHQVTIIQK
ncbi:MAG TPA: hypothetical protein VKW78_22935 [Terriglobales bacterium]|nr:hypothetical protein [Terriglobales bacterium]